MASFKVPCPSCEHQVPIKSESLIGTKVECPKCKYRFKVEEPAGGVPKEGEKADDKAAKAEAKTDKPGKGDKAEKKKGDGKKKSKKLVAVVVGVLAVGVLAAVGMTMMGGDDKPKTPNPNPNPGFKGNPVGPKGDSGDGKDGKDSKDPKDKDKKEKPPEKPKEKPRPPAAPSDKEPSNLLPGDTVALYRVDLDKVRMTPASFMFDRTMLEMFSRSFGFEADQVGLYYHAFVGPARDPFGVIRLKTPAHETDIVRAMSPTSGSKAVGKKWTLYSFKSNPFANGLSSTLAFGSLFGEWYEKLPPAKPPAGPRAFGLCVYDSQHVLVGDVGRIDAFLAGLDPKGYPKFLSATKPTGDQELAEQALYLSIDPKLKRVLRDLGAEGLSTGTVLYAEKLAQGSYDPKLLKADFQPVGAVLDPLLTHTNYLGATLGSFTPEGASGAVRLVMASDSAAFEAVRDHLAPNLPLAALAASAFLDTPVDFRNLTASGAGPATLTPGMDPTLPKTGPPVGPGTDPTATGMPPDAKRPTTVSPSRVELSMRDQHVTVAFELNWSAEVFRTKIEPRLVGLANTLKGKMAVFTSDESYYRLAAALPKFGEEPRFPAWNPRAPTDRLNFPRGTTVRPRDVNRLGIDHPPQTRVSMFAEMLPYFGREDLYRGINRERAWFDGDNLKAGEEWVPELLVPSYPQSAWRATSPFVADGRVLGGTNYVGIAGRGLDAARYDPADPEQAKKVGIVGYDWGSRVEDVKDGLGNTIYLMQTPPGLSQPWIAGGGATVRGLSEAEPMRGFAHTHGTPNKQPGTFALMGDGSVRFVPANIDPKVLLGMSTRAGMEDLADLNTAAPRVDPPKKKVEPKPEPKPAAVVEVAPPPREKKE